MAAERAVTPQQNGTRSDALWMKARVNLQPHTDSRTEQQFLPKTHFCAEGSLALKTGQLNATDLNPGPLLTSVVMPSIAFVVTSRISLQQTPSTTYEEKSFRGLSSGRVSNARIVKSRHPLLPKFVTSPQWAVGRVPPKLYLQMLWRRPEGHAQGFLTHALTTHC